MDVARTIGEACSGSRCRRRACLRRCFVGRADRAGIRGDGPGSALALHERAKGIVLQLLWQHGGLREVMKAYYSFFCHKLDLALNDEVLAASERMGTFVGDAKAQMAKHGYARLPGPEPRSGGQGVAGRPPRFAEQDRAGLKVARCLVLAREAVEVDVSADTMLSRSFSGSVGKEPSCGPRLVKNGAPLDTFIAGFIAGLPRTHRSNV
jgi:hypothetical protein